MNWQPLQKVIIFRREYPHIGYVSSTKIHERVTFQFGNATSVRVCVSPEDAFAGRCESIAETQLQPFSDALWAQCEIWMDRQAAAIVQYNNLRRGREVGGRSIEQPVLLEAA